MLRVKTLLSLAEETRETTASEPLCAMVQNLLQISNFFRNHPRHEAEITHGPNGLGKFFVCVKEQITLHLIIEYSGQIMGTQKLLPTLAMVRCD